MHSCPEFQALFFLYQDGRTPYDAAKHRILQGKGGSVVKDVASYLEELGKCVGPCYLQQLIIISCVRNVNYASSVSAFASQNLLNLSVSAMCKLLIYLHINFTEKEKQPEPPQPEQLDSTEEEKQPEPPQPEQDPKPSFSEQDYERACRNYIIMHRQLI